MSNQPDNAPADISARVIALRARIDAACATQGRAAGSVTLIGASKTQSPRAVQQAYASGVMDFGENYVDEALAKIPTCGLPAARWHFIGRIQSNKTRQIAENFTWVHTIDRLKIASRLARHIAETDPARQLNVLIQVNADADPNKAGVAAADAPKLLADIRTLPHLRPRGLMTILDPASDARASYASVAQLAADLGATLPDVQRLHWNCLSMGMSGDLEAAIAAGATHVRIGTDLFGPRT